MWEKNISRGELAILGTYEHPRNRKLKVRYGKDDMIRAQGYNNATSKIGFDVSMELPGRALLATVASHVRNTLSIPVRCEFEL